MDYCVQAFGGIRRSSFTSIWWQMEPLTNLWWKTWIVVYKPLVVCVDRRSRALGGRWRHLQAFGGIRGSSCTCLWWHTWIVVCKPLVADGAIYKPFVAYVERRVHVFDCLRGSSFTSLWWQMESFTSLWWHTWIVVYKAFGGVRGSSCRSLWWHTWIILSKPSVAYVDRPSQAFGGRWTRIQAFGGLRGSPYSSLWGQMESFTSLWWHTWIVVHEPLVEDGAIYKPLVAYVDRRVQGFCCRALIVV